MKIDGHGPTTRSRFGTQKKKGGERSKLGEKSRKMPKSEWFCQLRLRRLDMSTNGDGLPAAW